MADYYQSNELFRYALWGFAAVFIATTVLTIIEYSLFSGSVKDDVGDGFMFGGDSLIGWIHFSILFGGQWLLLPQLGMGRKSRNSFR